MLPAFSTSTLAKIWAESLRGYIYFYVVEGEDAILLNIFKEPFSDVVGVKINQSWHVHILGDCMRGLQDQTMVYSDSGSFSMGGVKLILR